MGLAAWWDGYQPAAGWYEVVWPVGSSSFGNAPVEELGPTPGSTGMPLLPLVLVPPPVPLVPVPYPPMGASEGAGVPLAGARYCCIIGTADPGPAGDVGAIDAADPVPFVAGVRWSSGIGFSDGVGDSIGGAVGWGCTAAGAGAA